LKNERIYAAIGAVDDELLSRCETPNKKRANPWLKYGSLAACLCLIVFGVYYILKTTGSGLPDDPALSGQKPSGRQVLQWSEQFAAEDYFIYNKSVENGMSSSASISADAIPYAQTRSFSDDRSQLEAEGVIPVMSNRPLFNCIGGYYEDGSLYSLEFSWHIRGAMDDYSDLSIIAGYQEVKQITDCISIAVDEFGNIVEPNVPVTVTERNGVLIVAEGDENSGKTMTFQNESGWYQIKASWNDSYEPMILLLDWIWEHPIDFDRFPIDAGDSFTHSNLGEIPDAFVGYIPDFAAFGFIAAQDAVTLKNGELYNYDGYYVAHAPEELVKTGNYYYVEGWTYIWWCIRTSPDFYDLQNSLGNLDELSEQIILGIAGNSGRFDFYWDGYIIQGYTNTPHELWAVIQSIQ